jgi:hypothetical protein
MGYLYEALGILPAVSSAFTKGFAMAQNQAGAHRHQDPAKRSATRSGEDDIVDSFFEVPAAVLCAICGQSDCPGCTLASEHESGVVAIIPWERPGAVWPRLWGTATAASQGADAFFAVLPDGEISPAMRFAVLAELLAVASMASLAVPLIALVWPAVALDVVQSASVREAVLRWSLAGIPAFALWLVLAHVTHGAALDAGARRQGAHPERRRAVRFGLYACGWDLMGGPLGALVMLFTRGLREAIGVVEVATRVRSRATNAFLTGIYQLPDASVPSARRTGLFGVVALGVVSAVGLILVGAFAR